MRPPVIAPFSPTETMFNFYIPPTILSDFHKFTHTDAPHANYTFEVLQDWYAKDKPDYEPVYLRGEIYPINWKSKIGNSDQSMNFRTSYEVPIRKGDILLRDDGQIFIVNWRTQEYINNQNAQINIANLPLRVYRMVDEVIDDDARVIEPAGEKTIVDTIPSIWKIYVGRPEYQVTMNMPGIVATDITEVYVQYNDQTKNIRINDLFRIEQYEYRVLEVQYSELDYDRTFGLLHIQAKRAAGGETAVTP